MSTRPAAPPTRLETDADVAHPAATGRADGLRPVGWLDRRIGTTAFYKKYGRKAFPVHSTFFFGEMALFAFVILVVTGFYLGLIYTPSNVEIDVDGELLPQAYASTRLIESIPVANVLRNVHHWGAHLMIASILLHMIRIFFSGTYRYPRELNWVIGMVMLGLSLVAGFLGYALPYDSYAVTATGIGYGIARSIPWVGNVVAELFFGGVFPTLGSIPRLYTLHVVIVPILIALATAAHLALVIKQKHSQPGYARRLAEPGRVLGVPFWPYQAILAAQLLLLMFGGLFLLSAFVPAHPLEAYGPPGTGAREVKPDWYLMWIYGFLKLIPAGATFSLPRANVGPEFLGGVLFPALIIGLATLAPWLDRTNRDPARRFEYLQPASQAPIRLALGVGVLTFLGMMFVASYYDDLGLGLGQTWLLSLAVPVAVAAVLYVWVRARWRGQERFDPTGTDEPAANPNLMPDPRTDGDGSPGGGHSR